MADRAYEITHPEYIHMRRDGQLLYGCDQDWYQIEWRRRAGCGPVAATNILLYLQKKYSNGAIPYRNGGVAEALEAMNDVFLFVRPKRRGLHTVKKFVKGMGKFGHRYGISLRYSYITVPPQNEKRPDLDAVVRFIEEGLRCDVPVAFLNLHSGEVEEQLSTWHWVTVVGMRTADAADGTSAVLLHYYDQSQEMEVDLGRWLKTTAMGGGFAYFREPRSRN